jgi:hypothetical protein
VGRGELFDRAEAATAEFARHGIRSRQIRVHYSYQPYSFSLLRELMIHAGMVAAECAHADNSYVDEALGQVSALRLR